MFFNAQLFGWELQKPEPDVWELHIKIAEQKIPLGVIPEQSHEGEISERIYRVIKEINNDSLITEMGDLQKSIREAIDNKMTKALGLRKFIREESSFYSISCTEK